MQTSPQKIVPMPNDFGIREPRTESRPSKADLQKANVEAGSDLVICCHFNHWGSCQPYNGTECKWGIVGHTAVPWPELTAQYKSKGKFVRCSKKDCRHHPMMDLPEI